LYWQSHERYDMINMPFICAVELENKTMSSAQATASRYKVSLCSPDSLPKSAPEKVRPIVAWLSAAQHARPSSISLACLIRLAYLRWNRGCLPTQLPGTSR